MLNKKKNVGIAHLGPRGLDGVVCWKCSMSQEAVSTTTAGAKSGRSRLLSVGTRLSLTVIVMMRWTPLLSFWSLSEQEITSRFTRSCFSVSSRNQTQNILSLCEMEIRGRLKSTAESGAYKQCFIFYSCFPFQ